jgi:hypothetical protein
MPAGATGGELMKHAKTALFYGALIWFVTFAASFVIYPLKTNSYAAPLFESVIAVTLAALTVLFALKYFKRIEQDYLNEGILIGVLWLAMNVIIDLPLFLLDSPMKMTIERYFMDIGVTYLMIPVITIGFGYLKTVK